MPVCVDCERWSPGTFKSCPDCSGVLKLEPLWARSSKDPQLARLDREAKWWHRRARDEDATDATKAEAWAMVGDRRRRYEELRRRLLPVLELAEARRVERMGAEARAVGLPLRTYEAKAAREGRERSRNADHEMGELQKARDTGVITKKEYEKRLAQRSSERDRERAQTEEADARALGLSVRAYRRRARDDEDERERLWGGEVPDPGWGQAWFIGAAMTVPITGVVGLIVALAFFLTGRSPLAAIAGTIAGGLAGWLLCAAVFFGTRSRLDRPTAHSRVDEKIVEPLSTLSLLGVFIVPSVFAILLALWLGSL
jgi:hypothetical protein